MKPQILCSPGGQAARAGALQPGEEKAPRRPYSGLPVPEGAYSKAGVGLFIRAGSNKMMKNCFKLEECRFRLDIRKEFITVREVRLYNRWPSEVGGAPPWKRSRPGWRGL